MGFLRFVTYAFYTDLLVDTVKPNNHYYKLYIKERPVNVKKAVFTLGLKAYPADPINVRGLLSVELLAWYFTLTIL